MTETLDPVTDDMDPQKLAEQLLAQAKEQGVGLVGPPIGHFDLIGEY